MGMLVHCQVLAAFLVWQTTAQNLGLSGQDHFNLMVESVQSIAKGLADIYNTSCGPADCPCSQDMCQHLLKDNTNTPSCLDRNQSTTDLYNCSSFLIENHGETANVCPSIMVTTSRSSVEYVRTLEDQDGVPIFTIDAICRTGQLDPVFRNWSSKTPFYTEYYVGLVDGSRRSFPGREEITSLCLTYDSRKRPWYNSGISYPNYLVILIDCGHDMDKGSTKAGTGRTRLLDARELALEILETVYKDDYVDVITFGADLDDRYNKAVQVNVDFNNSQEHPELESLKTKINSLSVAADSTTIAGFLTGLNTTLTAFSDTTLPNYVKAKRLQNIILFTDGSFTNTNISTSASVTAALNQIRSNNVRLFIYGINAGRSAQNLQSLADKVNVVYEDVTNIDNLLYNLRSYFGYLALSHKNLYKDKPYWTPDYEDFFGVGPIVTVTMPAFTGNNQFVGVAAIDVILNELPTYPPNFLDAPLNFQRGEQDNTYDTASNKITLTVPAALDYSSCQYNNNPLCPSRGLTSGENPQAEKCCNNCGRDDGREHSNTLAITLGLVFGVAGLVVGFAICGFKFWRTRKAAATVAGRPIQPRVQNRPIGYDTAGQTRWTQPL